MIASHIDHCCHIQCYRRKNGRERKVFGENFSKSNPKRHTEHFRCFQLLILWPFGALVATASNQLKVINIIKFDVVHIWGFFFLRVHHNEPLKSRAPTSDLNMIRALKKKLSTLVITQMYAGDKATESKMMTADSFLFLIFFYACVFIACFCGYF